MNQPWEAQVSSSFTLGAIVSRKNVALAKLLYNIYICTSIRESFYDQIGGGVIDR